MTDYGDLITRIPLPTFVGPERLSGESSREFRRRTRRGLGIIRNWHKVNQNNCCIYCGIEMVSKPVRSQWDRGLTLDHKIANCDGGQISITNTHAACRGCNQARGNMSHEQFMIEWPVLRKALVNLVNGRRKR